jgi:phytoene synthase
MPRAVTERTTDDALAREDAEHCAAIVRANARTFTLASRFLPTSKRRGAFAVYTFCRLADDIVDRAEGRAPSLLTAELDLYRAGVMEAVAGRPEGPIFRELWRAVTAFRMPTDPIVELLDGVARDLRPTHYRTWAELTGYCEGVASSVGTMCTWIFGVEGDEAVRERAMRYARTLGVAMQLTNILRDVGEDATHGRCYLPDADLATFGLDAERVLRDPTLRHDPRWTQLMQHEIARARALYRAAAPGIALLAADTQRCARACAVGYSAILGAIEQNGYDTLSMRAQVGTLTHARVLWDVWRAHAERPPADADGPAIEWGERVLSRPEEMILCV